MFDELFVKHRGGFYSIRLQRDIFRFYRGKASNQWGFPPRLPIADDYEESLKKFTPRIWRPASYRPASILLLPFERSNSK